MSYIPICNRSGFKTTVLSHNEINGKVGNSIVLPPPRYPPNPEPMVTKIDMSDDVETGSRIQIWRRLFTQTGSSNNSAVD